MKLMPRPGGGRSKSSSPEKPKSLPIVNKKTKINSTSTGTESVNKVTATGRETKKNLATMLQESSSSGAVVSSSIPSPRRVGDLEMSLRENDEHDQPEEEEFLKRDAPRVLFPQSEGLPISQSISQIDVYGSMVTKKRNKKATIAPLPTLSESSVEDASEADHINESFDSFDDGDVPFPSPESTFLNGPTMSPRATRNKVSNTNASNRPKPGTKRTAAEKMNEYKARAADLAARGLEEEAVLWYRRALHTGRRDVTRIKGQLKQVTTATHHTEVAAKSIASRLHEDWMEIGVLIANVRNAQATIYERLGVYDKAMTCCAEALAVYQRQAKFLKKRAPGTEKTVMEQIQHMTETTRRIDSARESYERRKRAHEEIIARRLELPNKAPAKRKECYASLHQKVCRVRSSETEILGPKHPQLGDTASLLGSLALEQGDKERAITYMMEAYNIMKESLGLKHPRTGMKLLHIASVYNNALLRRHSKEEDLATDYYDRAVQVFKDSKNCPFLLGSTLNDLAVVYIGRKDFVKGVQMLQEALEAYKDGQESDATATSWDTAQVWLNLGECYNQQRDFEHASNSFMNALNVQRDGRKVYENAFRNDGTVSGENVPPAHLVDDQRIADTMRRLGKAYVGAAAYDKAMVFFKEACLIHKNEVKKAVQTHKGRDTNLLPTMQDELAQTIYCMAELNDVTGKTDQASRLYSESLQLRLFSDAHKPTRSNMVHCAMCLNGLGSIHMKKSEFVEAEGVLKEALGYCNAHGVPAAHPIVQMIQQRLQKATALAQQVVQKEDYDEATKLEKRAVALFQQGKLDSAVLTLTSVMQLRKEALKKLRDDGEDSAPAKYKTACTLKIFGQVLAAKGDQSSAERAFRDSLKLFRKSGAHTTESVVVQVCEELSKIQVS